MTHHPEPLWQPIETAPHGEPVIRFEPAEYRNGKVSLSARIIISSGLYPRKATHWMPLPPHPGPLEKGR